MFLQYSILDMEKIDKDVLIVACMESGNIFSEECHHLREKIKD